MRKKLFCVDFDFWCKLEAPKNQKFCLENKRPITFYSCLNFSIKSKKKILVASKPVL